MNHFIFQITVSEDIKYFFKILNILISSNMQLWNKIPLIKTRSDIQYQSAKSNILKT